MKIFLWIALGLAVVALLATIAFNTQDTADNGMAPPPEAANTDLAPTINLAQVRADAAADLAALRARAEAGEAYDALAGDFATIRAHVTAAYQAAGTSTSAEWHDVQTDLDTFEASIRTGSSNVLDSFASLIARFSTDVRTETGTE